MPKRNSYTRKVNIMQENEMPILPPLVEEVKKKSHFPKNKKFFWVFFILSAIFLIGGGALLPVWEKTNVPWKNFATDFFSLMLSITIIVYIVGYLIRQIIRERKVAIKILTVFEAGFFFAVAVGSFLQYFDSASIGGPSTIVGIAFWSRGFVYIVKAYLCKHDENDKYPLWTLILSIGLVSLGSVMIANEMFTTYHAIWVVSITLLFVSLMMLVVGFVSKPKVDKDALALEKQEKKLKEQEKELAKKEMELEKAQKKKDKTQKKVLALEGASEEDVSVENENSDNEPTDVDTEQETTEEETTDVEEPQDE